MPTLYRRALGLSAAVLTAALVALALAVAGAQANDQRLAAHEVSRSVDRAALAVRGLAADRDLGEAEAALAALDGGVAASQALRLTEGAEVRAALAAYRAGVVRLRRSLVARGVDEESGAEGQFRDRVHDVEARVSGLAPDVLVPVLQARRREKDYLLRGRVEYVAGVRAHVAEARGAARRTLAPAQADTVSALLTGYEHGFLNLVALQDRVGRSRAEIRAAGGEARSAAAVAVARASSRARAFSALALASAVVSALVVGASLLYQTRRITRPLDRLRQSARRVAGGEADVRVPVEGPDEIRTLAQALNGVADYADRTAAAERRLAEAQAFLETAIGRAEEGVVVLDEDYRVAYANGYAERLFGMAAADAQGRRPSDLVLDPAGAGRRSDFERALAGEVVRTGDYRVDVDGREVWLAATYAPLAGGPQRGVVATVHDVSDRVATERDLREARDVAQAAALLKSSFLANMSHEIRTPLTGILGYADLLAQEAPPDLADLAAVILRSGHRLLDTLNSVLDLAQLESGTMEIACDPVDVTALVAQTAELHAGRAQAAGLGLHVDAVPGVLALADRRALGRVVDNLVSNALKFTPHGRVDVRLATDGDRAVLEVADTGIGMDPAVLDRMFEEFQQASSGHGRAYEGNGLGLTIVRRLVDLMGGGLAVESQPGVGTRFTLRLPLAGGPACPHEEVGEAPLRRALSSALT